MWHDRVATLVRHILEHPLGQGEWSLQGFGMLRLYLPGNARLHVWDSRYKTQDVSVMHTHPWHFNSYVVSGELLNRKFVEPLDEGSKPLAIPYNRHTILCGPGGGLVPGEPEVVQLVELAPQRIVAGMGYDERAEDIHISEPVDGTVTLVQRYALDDPDHAYVYWPVGGSWVTAEPRPAMQQEVLAITDQALACWDRWAAELGPVAPVPA